MAQAYHDAEDKKRDMRLHNKIKLSVIVPAFNEEKTLKQVLKALLAQKDVYEVIVVDDFSTDHSLTLAKEIKHKRIRVFSHKENRGKGAAIFTGLKNVRGTHTLIQDADLEYDPREIPMLLAPIRAGRASVVYGSRFFGAHTNMFYWHYVGNKFLNFIINVLYNVTLSDMETCYKVMPTHVMKSLELKEQDFRIEPEITCILILRGEKIFEVPITYVSRTYAEGKKITWKDGVRALKTILVLRFQ